MSIPYLLLDSGHGLSQAARLLQEFADPATTSANSALLCGPQWELAELARETSQDNWDGYGAKAISGDGLSAAREFLAAFTFGRWPAPELSVSPTGAVLIEWSSGPRHVFTLAFGDNGTKYYAGLFGANKRNGREDLLERVVEVASEGLARLYPTRAPRG